jgi:hypothetical protein
MLAEILSCDRVGRGVKPQLADIKGRFALPVWQQKCVLRLCSHITDPKTFAAE